MVVGNLGNIVFSVSPNRVETLFNVRQSGSAAYAEHKRHGGDTLLEFVGRNADSLSFDMILSEELGVDVWGEIEKIVSAEQSGEILRLVIGKKSYGRNKWVIIGHSVNMKRFDKRNRLVLAEASIELKEYL